MCFPELGGFVGDRPVKVAQVEADADLCAYRHEEVLVREREIAVFVIDGLDDAEQFLFEAEDGHREARASGESAGLVERWVKKWGFVDVLDVKRFSRFSDVSGDALAEFESNDAGALRDGGIEAHVAVVLFDEEDRRSFCTHELGRLVADHLEDGFVARFRADSE